MCHRSSVLLSILVVVVLAFANSVRAQSSPQSGSTNAQVRDWKDVTGQHTIRASFMGVIDRAKVALKTDDGKEMTIELSRLSNADIYEAVKLDLMSKLAVTSPVAASPAAAAPATTLATRKKAQPFSGKAKLSPRKAQSTPSLPVSKPKPTLDENLVARIEEFIETIETEDTKTIFQTILHPKEYAEFSKSKRFEAGLESFEEKKKDRLLEALQSIDLDSVERKPGGKYRFQTDSAPISFKNFKGTWYLNN